MLKIKSYKKNMREFYYKLLTPLAYIETKIRKHQDKKYENKQLKISKWTDEYAMNLYAKVLVKQMIRRNYRQESQEVFVVADWCDSDYGVIDVKHEITEQRINKDLKSWGYKLPYSDGKRIEKLTDLLKVELEKYEEITCKYIVDKEKYGYSSSRGYIKTLIVTIDKGDK